MSDLRVPPRSARRLVAGLLLLASALLFWKLRILDLGTDPRIEIGPIDLYIEHVPMAAAAYDALAGGRLPLWNPHQLGGLPFLAVPHVALLYPLHLFSLWVPAETAVEVSFVLHMWLGGVGMALLVRRLRLSALAATAGALTFTWSGWMIFAHVVPTVFAGLAWLPVTIFLIERAIDRERFALVALVPVVACQILVGASEVLVHTLLVAAVWSAARLARRARQEGVLPAARSGLALVGAMALAAALAAPQLLPSLELVAQSGRGGEGMSFEAAARGAIPPAPFLAGALGMSGLVTVGFLPFLALPLLLGPRPEQGRSIELLALGIAALGALLVFGGVVYEAYHALPGIGALFRRPVKFLDVHAFGQALLAAVAIARLEGVVERARGDHIRSAALWAAALVAGAAAIAAGLAASPPSGLAASPPSGLVASSVNAAGTWTAALALLIAFAALPAGRARAGVLVLLVGLQGACLFLGSGATHVRPVERPGIFHRQDALLADLRRRVGHQRVYLSDAFLADPALTPKQGTLAGLRVATDYEPLATRRSQRFFDLVTPGDQQRRMNPFAGVYALRPGSRFALLDLAATRLYVMGAREPTTRWMLARPARFRAVAAGPGWQVLERPSALPRAYLAADFVVHEDEASLRAALAAPGFDPRGPVLLEAAPSFRPASNAEAAPGRVEFLRDEAETVALEVTAPGPRLLVLADTDYPGWRAFVDDEEVPILRANDLFRAVEVGGGTHTVRFVYAPSTWRWGLGLGAAAAGALVLWAVLEGRSRPASRRRITSPSP